MLANGRAADSPGWSRSYEAVEDARQTRQGPSGRLVAKVPAPRRIWPRIRNGSPQNLPIVLVKGRAAGQPSEKDWKGQMPVRGRVEPKGAGGGPATDPRAAIRTWLIGIAVALAIAWTLRQTVWITLPLSVAFFIASAHGPSVAGSGRACPGLEFLGHAAAMAVIVLLLSLLFAAIRYAAHRIVAEFPRDAGSMKGLGEATRPD